MSNAFSISSMPGHVQVLWEYQRYAVPNVPGGWRVKEIFTAPLREKTTIRRLDPELETITLEALGVPPEKSHLRTRDAAERLGARAAESE